MSAQTKTSDSPERPTPLIFKLLLMVGVFAATIVLAEVGVRIMWSKDGKPFSPEVALEEFEKAGTVMQEGVERPEDEAGEGDADADDEARKGDPQFKDTKFLHPYYGWDVEGPHSAYAEQRDMFVRPRSEKTFDVVILGGSVAANFGWTGRDALFKELATDARFEGRKLRMFNHGIAGYKQPQQVNRLAYLFTLGYEPDLVINLDGFNEVALGYTNSASSIHPLHPSGGHWSRLMVDPKEGDQLSGPAFDALAKLRYLQLEAGAEVKRAEEKGMQRFALTTELAVWKIRKIRAKGIEAYEELLDASFEEAPELPIFGPEFPENKAALLDLLVEGWANASLSIQGLCEVRNIDYLHVLQPTLHDPGSKPLTAEELETSGCSDTWRTGSTEGYPLLRAAGKRLAAAGVEHYDASMVFADVTDTLYFDACHFVRAGQELLGRAIAREYLARFPADDPPRPVKSFRATSQAE